MSNFQQKKVNFSLKICQILDFLAQNYEKSQFLVETFVKICGFPDKILRFFGKKKIALETNWTSN